MTLNLHAPETEEQLQPRITVVGVGGAGGNAVSNMIQSNLEGVEFLVCNTDAQALQQSVCENRLQLGRELTRGLGGGSRPDVGRAAAEETIDEISELTTNSDMLFIAAGMGGATGTGAAPVIARAAREKGILTVAVVTKPFHFEGVHRMKVAEQGINELENEVDTLIIIPNQNLFRVANEKTTFADAFRMADEVLYSGVRGVTDLVVKPGLINLDFADIRSVMTEMGKAMMGTGEASGENRAIAAAEAAISNPLLDDVSMKGARGVLINITGGLDLTLFEVDEAANRIRDEVDQDANIIFGSTFDPTLEGVMRISVVSTGIDAEEARKPKPVTLSLVRGEKTRQQPEAAQPAAETAHQPEPTPASVAVGAASHGMREMAETTMAATGTDGVAQEMGGATVGTASAASAPAPAQEAAPESQPAAEEREDAFIAPSPVTAPRKPEAVAGTAPGSEQRPDPFQAAAVSNASGGQQTESRAKAPGARGRASSLFARVTGAARGIQGEREKPQEAPRRAEEPRLSRPAAERPAPEAKPQPQQPTARREPTAQQRLTGLDPADGYDSRGMEEDQLDIPAFLRRQAN
ncbi:cell division protein FtsZ [Ferruginivarius sediminum]|uniref:Cell division protein FtsZ n=1 Tax=Ferruginivarius sediminum TaxID=2661937 RepID=A0A369TAU3_9PROT|nr:cell division protein FtsZ [Ferruginivarius sediminum]RDD61297.1 cell division protein FtsZ [Ferruginivarius sediminum]